MSSLQYSSRLDFDFILILMHILLSNDDGCQAPGLNALADALVGLGELTIVAPDRDRSGASNSLTLVSPIRARSTDDGRICVDGTPTDCVHLAITGLLESEPDIVVSGINAGANMGDDVIYSGTVAAAMEGRFLGLPAIAVSMTSHQPRYFDTAAQMVRRLLQGIEANSLSADTVLNINVPDIPLQEIKGFQTTRLGKRHKAEPVIKAFDPRGEPIYWVGAAGPEADAGPSTDFHAVRSGWVSVTPLHADLTSHDAMQPVDQFLQGISL